MKESNFIDSLIHSVVEASTSPVGEIIVRVTCVFIIGAVGVRLVVKAGADIFELFATPKKKKVIETIADFLGYLGCLLASVVTSILYAKGKKSGDIYIEGLLYGFGALGIYKLWITGKLKAFFNFFRRSKK